MYTICKLDTNSVYSILEYTANDGKIYNTGFYNLDAILSIGYRVNSRNATLFHNGQIFDAYKFATDLIKYYTFFAFGNLLNNW